MKTIDIHGLTSHMRVVLANSEEDIHGTILEIDQESKTACIKWDNGHTAHGVDIDELIPEEGWVDSNPEPAVKGNNGETVSYSTARIMWENGEFSDWADSVGFPLEIDGASVDTHDGVEDALSDNTWDK